MVGDFVPDAGQKRFDILAKRGHEQFAMDFTCSIRDLTLVEQDKRTKYQGHCDAMQIRFQPFAISPAASTGPDTKNFLDKVLLPAI